MAQECTARRKCHQNLKDTSLEAAIAMPICRPLTVPLLCMQVEDILPHQQNTAAPAGSSASQYNAEQGQPTIRTPSPPRTVARLCAARFRDTPADQVSTYHCNLTDSIQQNSRSAIVCHL